MTNDELEAIRARDAACAVPKTVTSEVQWVVSNADRRALLTEVDRLREWIKRAPHHADCDEGIIYVTRIGICTCGRQALIEEAGRE